MPKVLICDDDVGITDMMKIMLEGICEVEIVTSGKAILKKVKELLPNLILLDLWMPGIDGREVARLLKKDAETKHIPIIVISALHKSEVKKVVGELQVEGFLLKPFSMVELQNLVQKYK